VTPVAAQSESPLDRLFGWLGLTSAQDAAPLPSDFGRYPGPAPQN
jgi:hypothetical protein